MDAEVLRVVMEIAAFFAIAAAGIWGFPLAGFGMAALAAALLVPAMDARDFAEILHLFRCDESCDGSRGWRSTEDAWQWDALWIAAVAGIVTLWISVAFGVAAGALGVVPRTRRIARRAHFLAAVHGDRGGVVRRVHDHRRSVRRSVRDLGISAGTRGWANT